MAMAIALAAAACTSPNPPPPPTSDGGVDFRECAGLLSLLEVQSELERFDLVRRSIDMTETVKSQNPAIQESCVVGFETPRKTQTITLTAIKFHSGQSAASHLAELVGGMRERWGELLKEGELGPDSYQIVLNDQDVGSVVGFMQGPHIIQLHTLYQEDVIPLADVGQLVKYAEVVGSRLS